MAGFAVVIFAAFIMFPSEAPRRPDPERARFMLECVSDHQYAPSTCAAIWEGEDPPQMANGVKPGC